MDDRAIVELYHRREERAIAETDKKYGGLCRSIALRLLGVREDAEECVNDTWSGTVSACGETLRTWAISVTKPFFGVLAPVSYCARRTLADFFGNPNSIPSCVCVILRSLRKKRILSAIAVIATSNSFVIVISP